MNSDRVGAFGIEPNRSQGRVGYSHARSHAGLCTRKPRRPEDPEDPENQGSRLGFPGGFQGSRLGFPGGPRWSRRCYMSGLAEDLLKDLGGRVLVTTDARV